MLFGIPPPERVLMRDKAQQDPEILEAIRQHLTDATHHHYVSEFLLRRFSTNPSAKHGEHPPIYRLDVKTGEVSRKPISTRHTTVIQHHNDLSAATGLPTGYAEAGLALVEDQAAPLFEKLIHHEQLDGSERTDFSTFLMLQQRRTPTGREWLRFMQDQAATLGMLKQVYENHAPAQKHLRKSLGRQPTEEEINEFIQQMAEPLKNGELIVSGGLDLEILGMFAHAPDIAPLIFDMNWTVFKAPAGQGFILSDEPLVLLDAHTPDNAVGWGVSSLEATMPLDPQYCLLLQQEPRQAQGWRVASANLVLDINLRTYAWARESIFGPTEQLLKSVYAAAQAHPYRVDRYRPKPPNLYVVERTEGEEKPSNVTRIPGPDKITIRRKRGHE